MRLTIISIFLVMASLYATAQEGVVKGTVVDATNNEPLPFVNVVIMGTTTGAVTDLDGNFQIFGLNSGFIRLTTSFVGYRNTISDEFEVSNANVANITIKMESVEQQIDEIIVKASPFRKTEESPLSLRSIGVSEIETNPGANRDISKVIQSFPGVTSTPAFRNDIIIRGGGPSESVFYLDGIEVPNINHFATQGASGGPVGIINADFIREVKYYSGAFPSNRSDALSGVLEFTQVDGNSEELKFRGSLGASEVTATIDGPIGENTNYIVSTRRSYLKFLFGIIELPFLPTFNDMQFKVKTRIDQRNEITFTGLGAIDLFDLNTGIDEPDEFQEYILTNIAVNEQWTYTVGGVYKHFHNNGLFTVALSRNHLNNQSIKYFDNDDSNPDNLTLDYLSNEIENKLRVENTNRFNVWKVNYGFNTDLATYTNDTYQKRFFGGQQVIIDYNTDINIVKWGLFGQVSRNFLGDDLTVSIGTRFDANNYSASMSNMFDQFSPRASLSYNFSSDLSFNANYGRYYQLPPYTSLGYKENNAFVNKENNLKYIRSDHYIAGFEYKPSQVVQYTVEGFLKNYDDYPFSVEDQISLANKGADYGVLGDEEVLSIAEGRAYGLEVLARINNQKNLTGSVSYTLVRSEFKDVNTGDFIPSSWDSKHLLTTFATYKLKNNWSIGAKWRFVGGLPYTPYDLKKTSIVEAWEATGRAYLDYSRINAERFSAFHQLDLRVDKAFYLKKFTAKFYIDIQNAYNFQTESQDVVVRARDAGGNFITTDNGTRYQLRSLENRSGTILPTLGIIFEL
ncbi:MAG: TonB-dependent receptor [Prolixibacteraceae bacterium]|nr:TonB-dependent receptor [Prolixibacteraceae bacterium]MBN2648608.1 TonB-dependent receptor [Prolixibacteraceae bacterium]